VSGCGWIEYLTNNEKGARKFPNPIFVPFYVSLCRFVPLSHFVFGPTVPLPLFFMVENNCGQKKGATGFKAPLSPGKKLFLVTSWSGLSFRPRWQTTIFCNSFSPMSALAHHKAIPPTLIFLPSPSADISHCDIDNPLLSLSSIAIVLPAIVHHHHLARHLRHCLSAPPFIAITLPTIVHCHHLPTSPIIATIHTCDSLVPTHLIRDLVLHLKL